MVELFLPNPGNGRYWEITDARDGDARLTLYSKDDKALASDYVFKPVNPQRIGEVAHMLMQNAVEYIGVYKFEGEE